MENNNKYIFVTFSLFFLIIFSLNVCAEGVHVANSENWQDVYSVLLSSSLESDKAIFLNSESITSITRTISTDFDLNIYESSKNPHIKNLKGQLSSSGYVILNDKKTSNFNLELDPQNGKYLVMSEDNPRISISLGALAVKEGYWVLIVTEDSVGEIVNRLSDASEVIAVGNFRRDYLEEIQPYFKEWINNNDLFEDSKDIAVKVGMAKNIVLADGSFLETEFFSTGNPVLLSGPNKVLDDIFIFLQENRVENVVVVGNQLAVVGEQIRTKSNKEISVFIKYGQGDAYNTGKIYALTTFPLPQPLIAITVEKATYNPSGEEVIIYFKNLGNTGVYELTTFSVKNENQEIGSASDKEVLYLGAQELLPVRYDVSLPVDELTDETFVEFYTSFGLYPSQLDTFLTTEGEYGPPFQTKLLVEDVGDDSSILEIVDVAYYTNLKRVGVKVLNNGTSDVYYTVKIQDLIVNGLPENLFKQDMVKAGQEKTTYIPIKLDKIDIEENTEFKLSLTYGSSPELLLKSIKEDIPFKVLAGGLSLPIIIAIVLILIAITALIFIFKNKSTKKKKKKK